MTDENPYQSNPVEPAERKPQQPGSVPRSVIGAMVVPLVVHLIGLTILAVVEKGAFNMRQESLFGSMVASMAVSILGGVGFVFFLPVRGWLRVLSAIFYVPGMLYLLAIISILIVFSGKVAFGS